MREREREGHNIQEREDMTHTQALRNIVHSVDSSVFVLVWSAQVVAHTERSQFNIQTLGYTCSKGFLCLQGDH